MRTVRTVKSGIKNIEDYYTEDESLKRDAYYSDSEMESEGEKVTSAQWVGSKAEALDLEGAVSQDTFKQLFYGELPTGQRMRGKPTTGRENLAVDMTLSAPKSFSLHALEDMRLFDAHMSACQKTLAAAEQYYCFQRTYDGSGNRINVKGDGFVAAAIPHWTSREMDAQLHSHVLIFNGCQGADGKWRAFDDGV